ncbi:type I polyketide synthase [Kitasatospora sp. NPDC056076]|uniref:type I polyketide synthase n=1 Tax=Kitasatospora sp. NPDC056076 TaxID=3345703 RepID=UPI0035E0C81B
MTDGGRPGVAENIEDIENIEDDGAEDGDVEAVAVIGFGCRVPGARDVDTFWHNMREGVESITRFDREELLAAGNDPEAVDDPDQVPASGYLPDADRFDAAFFGLGPAEAEAMDPQHRLFCETAWEAFENSGHDPAGIDGSIGVFAGSFMNKYLTANLATNARFQRSPMAAAARIYNDKDFLATRAAHLLDLDGPAFTVQSACSTSLVATHVACQSLLGHECDVALAGGVTVNVPLKAGYPVAESGLFSADGHCRPFDAGAGGTVPGNGAVVLVLRRLSDALAAGDHVYAVIKGSAVNNDGSLKAGFTAPSVDGQARVVATALALAGVAPETVGYLEAHGTATRVGDPIEVTALAQAFGRPDDPGQDGQDGPDGTDRYCALGSVKANIGHLDAAAGAAGLMRAALAVHHGVVPPTVGFRTPNPELRLEHTPFRVPTAAEPWTPAGPRRAGVSAFGVGGTNAHVILEQAPRLPRPTTPARPWQLLPLSGDTGPAVASAASRLADHLDRAAPELPLHDVAFTLQAGRRAFRTRGFAVCRDRTDAVDALRGARPGRLVTRPAPEGVHEAVFMFPGGGMQHPDMGLDVYRSEEVFREEVDRCAELLGGRLGFDLRRLLFPSAFPPLEGRRLVGGAATMGRGQGAGVVCALFTVEYALACQLLAWGVRPAAMIGHSLGEYVAAALSGVLSLPEALDVTLARGELFAAMPPGRMLVVALPEERVVPLLGDRLSVAAVNAPGLTVVAGPDEEVAALLTRLRARDVDCRKVSVPVASHSWMVEPYLPAFADRVAALNPSAPAVPFVSGVTGDWITDAEAKDPGHWVRHLRQPVRFADGLRTVLGRPGRVLVEIGPGRALTQLAAAQQLAPAPVAVPTMGLPRDPLPDLAHLVTAVGRLWQSGVPVDWRAFHGEATPRRVPLPGRPFAGPRYWVERGSAVPQEPAGPTGRSEPVDPAAPERPEADAPRTERERQVAEIWCDLLGIERIGCDADVFDLGAHSLMVTQATRQLRRLGATALSARDVLGAPTVAELAALVDRIVAGEPAAAAPGGPDLAAEVTLDPAITAAGLPAPAPSAAPRAVLLTGATGFVGAFLCAELLRRTEADVHCLVRAATPAEGLERVRAALDSYGLDGGDSPRLRVVRGDLAQPMLGLTEDAFDRLADTVDAVHHCGAWVNFVRPYRALKAANVLGTQEVLRLATRRRLKPVHHVSTLAVLAGAVLGGADRIREDDPLPPPVGHDTAYSQSKWVAEGLIGLARARGVPVSVYRAGGVLPSARSGAANSEDYITKVVQGCVQLGLAPQRRYDLSVGTVDHLARLVVGLSLEPAALDRTYHTIDPRPLAWDDIFAYVRAHGFPVRSVPFAEWRGALVTRVEHEGEDNALAPLMAMIGEVPDRRMPVMDCANVRAHAAAELATAPALEGSYFARMLDAFVRRGLLPPPQDAPGAPAATPIDPSSEDH